jgi:hypothetical protein
MENVKQNPFQVAAKWAVIYVITSIVITYLMQFSGVDQTTSPLRYLTYIPLIAFLLLAQKEYRDQLGGFMTFGQGFMAGFLYSVVIGVLTAIFTYIYFTYLSPQVWEQVLASSKDKMAQNPNLSSEQIDKAMEITQKYGVLFATIAVAIVTPIIGTIIALIGAAIFKKERSILDIEQGANSYTDPSV